MKMEIKAKAVRELIKLADVLDKQGLLKGDLSKKELRKAADIADHVIQLIATEEDDGPSIKLYCPQCKEEMGELGNTATEEKCKSHAHQLNYWNTDPSHGKLSS